MSALDAALSMAACNEALASRADVALASLDALEGRGFRGDNALCDGVAILLGECARGRPLPRGVALGAGSVVSPFAVKTNLGGGEIDFFSSVLLATGASSRSALIHGNIP